MLHLDSWEELAEALVLLADLEGELPGVAHDQHRHLVERDGHIQHVRRSRRSSNPPVRRQALSAGAWPARTRPSCPCRTWPGTGCPSPARPGTRTGYWRPSTRSDEGGMHDILPGGYTRAGSPKDARSHSPRWPAAPGGQLNRHLS